MTVETIQKPKLSFLTLRVLTEGFASVMKSLLTGVGGLQPLVRFMNQVQDERLIPLSQVMSVNLLKYQRALHQTNPALIAKKPETEQEDETFYLLGKDDLVSTVRELAKLRKPINPRITTMYRSIDYYREAFLAGYKAINTLMEYLAEQHGMEEYVISDPQFLHYLELLRVGRLKGESRISREERELLCFLVYGNLAQIHYERAEELVKKAIEVIKFGYLSELVEPAFFDLFEKAQSEYQPLLSQTLAEIIPKVISMVQLAGANVIYNVPLRADRTYWYPALIVPDSSSWQTGKLMGEVTLEPFPQMPVFTRQDMGSINGLFGQPGQGKTFWLNALASFSIMERGHIVFVPLSDDSNQPILSCMPLFPYNESSKKRFHKLANILKLKPQGLPTLILDIIRPEDLFLLDEETLTIYDRIIETENPRDFDVDLNLIINELSKISESYGFKKPCGLIAVRNLGRLRGKENVDLQVAFNLIYKLMDYAEKNRQFNFRMQFDEISELAPSQYKLAGSDTYQLGGMISSLLKRCRRKRISIDFCSQRVVEVLTELRDMATNTLWRELGTEQLDVLLQQSIQIYDEDLQTIIKDINEKGSLRRTYLWNFYHKESRSFTLAECSIPPHMTQDVKLRHQELFKKYEEQTGRKLLVDKFEDVPVIFKDERKPRAKRARKKTVEVGTIGEEGEPLESW